MDEDGADDVHENDTEVYSFTTSDPGVLDTFVLVDANCGDLGELTWIVLFDSATGSGKFSCYFEDDAELPIGHPADPTQVYLEIRDDDGDTGIDFENVLVRNVDPVADIGPDRNIDEGDVVTFDAVVTDQGPADTFPGTGWLVECSYGQIETGQHVPLRVHAD